jgi:mannosyltransferase OCH1-like enzyme
MVMIPKILHFIWMQGFAEMPEEQRAAFKTWAPQHTGWAIRLWDRTTLPDVKNAWVLKVCDMTVQSDVLRFEIVHQFGGVYLDCDMVCRQPLDSVVAGLEAFVSMRTRDCLASSSFGASKGNPWMADMLDEISACRSRLVSPGSIRGPLERVTRKHPEVVRIDRSILELPSASQGSVATHRRSCTWKERKR